MPQDIPHNLKLPDLPAVNSENVQEFISRWQNTKGSGAELADFQSFLVELCELLGVPKPDPKSDSTKDDSYIFERPVESFTATGELKNSKNRIDLYRQKCFVMEGKQTGKLNRCIASSTTLGVLLVAWIQSLLLKEVKY